MKSTLTLGSLLFLSQLAHSQITITSADMPDAGDSVRVSFATSLVDPAPTGANYTWDFSSLTANAQDVQVFTSPTTFAVPYNFLFNILNTSYGAEQFTPDSIAGFQPEDAFNYFKENSGDFRKIGMGMTLNSIPLPMQYSQPDYLFRFPMNYGNMDSCDAEVEITIPGFGTYAQFIHRVNEVDGWGQLTTPFGTVAALRIKSIVNSRDSIAPEGGGGFAFDRPTVIEYKWLSDESKIPYLQIDATDLGGTPTVTNIVYQDVYQPGVFQLGNQDYSVAPQVNIYPNPASDVLYIRYHLQQSEDIKFELMDMTGKMLDQPVYQKSLAGENITGLSIQHLNLQNGTYLMKLSGTGFSTSVKFLVK